MISFINSWTKGIIIAVIICTIIEMIIPEGKNKKYIRAIMGIYIIFNMLSPIIKNKRNISFNYNILDNQNDTITTSMVIDTNKYIEDLYIEKIKEEIKNNLKNKNYNLENIKVEIETDDEKRYGEILSISVKVSNIQEQSDNSICINKIIIGNEVTKETKISQYDKEEIKNYLSINYGIDKERIEVF